MKTRKLKLYNRPKNKYRVLLLGITLLLFQTPALASKSTDSHSPHFIEGYDVVSYFRDSGPVPGNIYYPLEYDAHTLLFASEQNLIDFKTDPESYMPAYNGYCAYGMVYGMKSRVNPLQYDIVDGRLYLQLDGGTKKRWNRRVGRNIRKSDKIWKKMTLPSQKRR